MFNFIAETSINDTIISIANLIGYIIAVGVGGTGYHYLNKSKNNSEKEKGVINEISSSIMKNKIIQSCLRDCRQSIDADRALIFLYHNREIFANGNHLLKVSCAFESLNTGITSVSPNYLNIPYVIFRKWDVGKKENPSVFHISKKNDNNEDPLLVQMLIEGGVESKYTLPLDNEFGANIGFISFHYLRETNLNEDEMRTLKTIPHKIARVLSSSAIEEKKK